MKSRKRNRTVTSVNGRGNGQRVSSRQQTAEIRLGAWLADGLLLLAGRCASDRACWPCATMKTGDDRVAANVEVFPYEAANGEMSRSRGALFVARCEPGHSMDNLQSVVLGEGPEGPFFGPMHCPSDLEGLQTLLRETVAGLSAQTRSEIMRFLVSAAADSLAGTCGVRISRALFAAREVLRERLPGPNPDKACPFAGIVETLVAVNHRSFYVRGWVESPESPVTRLTAVSPEGCRIELRDRIFRCRRPDLDGRSTTSSEDDVFTKTGFICYFEADVPSRRAEGWLVEVANSLGDEIELPAPPVQRGTAAARRALLPDIAYDPIGEDCLLSDHLAPALRRIQERQRDRVRVDKVVQYGTAPSNPTVSIIIPLYARVDLVEQQLAQFVHDREMRESDVIYVLDSPELSDSLFAAAPRLQRLYRTPFRVAILNANAGYAAANNAGASLSRGRLLLLMGPNVFPDRPGGLGKMTAFYDAKAQIGALGPKLLFEDDCIQHAGLYFDRDPDSVLWHIEHRYRGLHRTLPPANVAQRVSALSGACLMIAADLYGGLGGLNDLYIQRGYEDSDLCLRLTAAGRENWYLPEVELYHLQEESDPDELMQLAAPYNRWLHTHLRRAELEQVQSSAKPTQLPEPEVETNASASESTRRRTPQCQSAE